MDLFSLDVDGGGGILQGKILAEEFVVGRSAFDEFCVEV